MPTDGSPERIAPAIWPGWKAKFLSSNAATLLPQRAHAILEEFEREHIHAPSLAKARESKQRPKAARGG